MRSTLEAVCAVVGFAGSETVKSLQSKTKRVSQDDVQMQDLY